MIRSVYTSPSLFLFYISLINFFLVFFSFGIFGLVQKFTLQYIGVQGGSPRKDPNRGRRPINETSMIELDVLYSVVPSRMPLTGARMHTLHIMLSEHIARSAAMSLTNKTWGTRTIFHTYVQIQE
jgi:hypothetical protein